MKITTRFLVQVNACVAQVVLFSRIFPEGAETTPENLLVAARAGLDISWLRQFIFPAAAAQRYNEEIGPARKHYNEEIAAVAWKRYDEEIAAAQNCYDEETAPAWQRYNEEIAPVLAKALP